MKKTFVCDDSMIITIPIGSLNCRVGQVMPEKFHCVFRNGYKVFVLKGKPKPLGVAQAVAGVLVTVLSLMFIHREMAVSIFVSPSFLFVVCGVLTSAAGHFPNMYLAKLSFAMNILGLLWSITTVIMFGLIIADPGSMVVYGICGLIVTLQTFQMFSACFLIYWQSKAVCKDHFNTMPIVLLKQADSK